MHLKSKVHHEWELSTQQAIQLQRELAAQVRLSGFKGMDSLHRVAATDVGFEEEGRITRAAVAVLSFPQLQLLDQAVVRAPTRMPYIPGLLSFRELPALLEALRQLNQSVDLVLCDGQGIAHPRRLGIAAHLGVLTGLTTVGVAKSRLLGEECEPGPLRGDWCRLMQGEEWLGAVLRSRAGVKPLYVSPGYGLDQQQAIEVTMACVTRYRLPEPIRWAHRLASDPRYRC